MILRILFVIVLAAVAAFGQTTRPAMRVLNATSADLDLPRVAVLSNDLLWPGERWSEPASRRTVPTDQAIAATVGKAMSVYHGGWTAEHTLPQWVKDGEWEVSR